MSEPKARWVMQFATHLYVLMPGIDGVTAAELAQIMWEQEGDQQPALSAVSLARRLSGVGPDDLFAARQRAQSDTG